MHYEYNYALASGVPLGGIGTGSIEIKADGRLYNWSIFNNGFYTTRPEYRNTYFLTPKDFAFFVRTKDSQEKIRVRVLQAHNYYYAGSPYSFPWIKPIKSIEFDGSPPFAILKYNDDELPVNITLEAFSSFIPGDLKNSTIPAGIFKFTIEAKDDIEFSILSLLRSPFELTQAFVKPDTFSLLGRELKQDDPRNWGSVSVGSVISQGNAFSGVIVQPKDLVPGYNRAKELINLLIRLRKDGYVESKELQKAERNVWGYTGVKVSLKKGERTVVYFILSWYFPNHIDEYGERLGHYYEKFFGYSEDVVNYIRKNLNYLEDKTRKFHDILYNPEGVEKWIADLIGAQLSTLIKSTLLTKNGAFGWWEGIWESYDDRVDKGEPYYGGPANCAFNTTDVMAYSIIMLITLFPELAKDYIKRQYQNVLTPSHSYYPFYVLSIPENGLEYKKLLEKDPEISVNLDKLKATLQEVINKTGKDPKFRVPHFFSKSLKRVDQYHMIDLPPKLELMTHLYGMWTGDLDIIKELFDTIVETLKSLERTNFYDDLPYHYTPSGFDWLSTVSQLFKDIDPTFTNLSQTLLGTTSLSFSFQTFDVWSFLGHSAYASILWATALKSLFTLSRLVGKEKEAEEFDIKYKKTLVKINSELWNGTYFRLWKDPKSGLQDDAIMSAQLLGEYYARLLGLGYTTSKEQVRTTLKTIYEYNYQDDEGLINGSYPEEERPAYVGEQKYSFNLPFTPGSQMDTPWSGVEYMVTSHMVYEYMIKEAEDILKSIKNRYERAGHFWNHVEWGANYMRPASAWGLIYAYEGMIYDGFTKTLYLEPKVENLSWILAINGSWGRIEINKEKVKVFLEKGNLKLNRIILNGKVIKEGDIEIKEGEVFET